MAYIIADCLKKAIKKKYPKGKIEESISEGNPKHSLLIIFIPRHNRPYALTVYPPMPPGNINFENLKYCNKGLGLDLEETLRDCA